MAIETRTIILALVNEAVSGGARRESACDCIEVEIRTLQRWEDDVHRTIGDQRAGPTSGPANKFGVDEIAKIAALVSSKEFCDLAPTQIIPRLADRGEYVGSESSLYRFLHRSNLDAHRGRARPAVRHKPQEFVAKNPNEVWSWDITYMKSNVRGIHFYLYLFMDIFSRKIVGYGVYDRESADISASLFSDICFENKVVKTGIVLHADNGGPMKGATMLAKLQDLGVIKSFSRASVSDDNPFSESLFRTMKYRPGYPNKSFKNIEEARVWVDGFAKWYNTEHLHSEISFTTPESRHNGLDCAILKKREEVYKAARAANPLRWSGQTRDWSRVEIVSLNPVSRERKPSREPVKKIA